MQFFLICIKYTKKDCRLVISCTKDQSQKIKDLAKEQGLTLSAYLIKLALGE